MAFHSNENENVRNLNNEYTRSNPGKNYERIQRMRILKRRRLLVFFVLAFLIMTTLTITIVKQNNRLEAKAHEKMQVEQQLQQLEEQQEMLKVQIAKLEDDEYIAKLARKEYFLSEEGEILFTIPQEDEEGKKAEEKE